MTVYTGAGEDTPIDLYWGRAIRLCGDSAIRWTLLDEDGEVQAELEIEAGE